MRERGHEVIAVTRPGRRERAALAEVAPIEADAGDTGIRELIRGCTAVLHFGGVPDPDNARRDPARAVRENVGTTLNLLEGCAEHGAGLVYPSSVRAAVEPPPDAYAVSKRLGEEACRIHTARAIVLRLTSVFGPGQLVPEGATGAIAAFAWRALAGEPIVIPGDSRRTRDFVYVDDFAAAVEQVLDDQRWNETLTVASGRATPLIEAAELVKEAAGSISPIETPGGELAAGEDQSYTSGSELAFTSRPLPQSVELYVDWLRRHTPAQGRA
jgi:nucleoside-diphosphate-sugar epimerase